MINLVLVSIDIFIILNKTYVNVHFICKIRIMFVHVMFIIFASFQRLILKILINTYNKNVKSESV